MLREPWLKGQTTMQEVAGTLYRIYYLRELASHAYIHREHILLMLH